MSQQIPFPPVPQEQNVFVRYQKISQEEKSKIRSGIIERYTYKTDNGELLKTPSMHKIGSSNRYTSRIISINRKSQNTSGESSNVRRSSLISTNKIRNEVSTPIRSYVHRIVQANVPILSKIGNSSKANDEKVRTEHCDSTTDIVENFDMKNSNLFISPYKQSNDNNVSRNNWKSSQDDKVDSDSDCEIIEVKSSDINNSQVSKTKSDPISVDDKEIVTLIDLNKDIENLKNKVLDWITIEPLMETEPVVHVISDDSDEESEFLCDKTGLKTTTTKIEKNIISTSDTQLHGKETTKKLNEKSFLNSNHRPTISNKSNISIILQKQDHSTKYPTKTKECISFRSDAKPGTNVQEKDTIHLINDKYYRIKTNLGRDFKSSVISSSLCSNSINSMNLSPPKQCSNIIEKDFLKNSLNATMKTNENELKSSNIQKMNNAPLSPESIKSEFYNYLKINTNPSAQKAETIAQNRRSTRVKNLILQIERNKEQQSLKTENNEKKKDRANDIRKKFMKYSTPNVVFPNATLNCYKYADFDPVIEAYFYKEKIPCKLYEFYSDDENVEEKIDEVTIKKESTLFEDFVKEEDQKPIDKKYTVKNKKIPKLRNRILKKKRRKQCVTKIIGCTPHISDIKLRRLRFKPNRIFRDSVRITRHSLDGFKVMPRKSKLKTNMKVNLKKKKLKAQEFNKEKVKKLLKECILETQSKKDHEILESNEAKLKLKDIKVLLTVNESKISDVDTKLVEANSNFVESKLTITEAKCIPLELKLQISEPKLTIREVETVQAESKTNEINTSAINSSKTISNKLTITEVKNSTNYNLDDKNMQPLNVDIPTSSLATHLGAISPNNILLPNVLASKLSLALNKNVPVSQTKERKNQAFTLNSIKSEERSTNIKTPKLLANKSPSNNQEINYFIGFKKTETKMNVKNIIPIKSRPLSPVCFGFEPDEKSAKICKMMQEVVSNLDTDILVTSNSPIQTPEPIEHLVPEIRINSIPITNEPCNLQEVMSFVSSEHSASQDLTSMLHNEDASSDYSEASSAQEEHQMEIALGEIIDPALIEKSNSNVIPLNQNIKTKSFHKSLMQTRLKQKPFLDVYRSNVFEQSDSDSSMATPKINSNKNSLTHGIDINSKGGAMFTTYYVNGILIIVQEFMITFWKQTALGNILGAQNMWLPNGSLQRIILERGCINRRSSEMVLTCENSVAYIELWTKQHESKFRECPIADVFATIYFHKGHGIPDKKVLQLENIKGYGHDVRFVVIKSSREIIVSWCDTFAEPIKTLVRCYQLAPDFQTVCSVKEMECINHCLISLHNIQDCEDLVLGAGNEQISVWNLRHGYLVTTLNLADSAIKSSLENKSLLLYAQCDTGFLFLIQQIEVGVLRLVAVNGITQEWKQLQSYQVPPNYKELLGIIVESGVLMTCYTNGFLCWNMNNGQILAEIEMVDNIVLPTNKYLVAFKNYQVKVQHIMSYILTHDW